MSHIQSCSQHNTDGSDNKKRTTDVTHRILQTTQTAVATRSNVPVTDNTDSSENKVKPVTDNTDSSENKVKRTSNRQHRQQ